MRYKTNDYSVPVAYGYREIWIRAYVDEVVIGCKAEIIASHPRSYDREDMAFDPIHYLPLIERKSEPSRRHRSEPDGERLGSSGPAGGLGPAA